MVSCWNRQLTRRRMLRSGVVAGLSGITGTAGCLSGPTPEEQVADVRKSLEKYRDVTAALNEGYVTTAKYVHENGRLGIPFINHKGPAFDPKRPPVLFYDLSQNGQYELVGAEWYVSVKDHDSPPSLFGKDFHEARAGHIPEQPRHYGLHVWAFSDNPEGLFARYNPALSPPTFLDTLESVRERLRPVLLGADAEKNGYRNTEKCVQLPGGGYGVPFVNEDAPATDDPTAPPLLLYRVTTTWSYVLLGAEWYVPASETDSPPSLFDQRFHEPMAGHSPKVEQPEHYGLHAWLFWANPGGMFAVSHPNVSC